MAGVTAGARGPYSLAAALALPLAALFGAASLGNLVLPSAYALEAPLWAAQGIGQDWVDLLVAAPALAALAWLARRGSGRAALLLGGALAYTAYSLVLYAFALHFNPLFLAYALALGLSFYALLALVLAVARQDAGSWCATRAPALAAGAFSTFIGIAFAALWLGEILPALATGATPRAIGEAGLITNPVQVLDLGIVLPAFIVGGIALMRRRPLGCWLVPLMLAFGVFMDLALIGMDLSMAARGLPGGGQRLPVFVVMAAASLAMLWALLRRIEPRPASLPGTDIAPVS